MTEAEFLADLRTKVYWMGKTADNPRSNAGSAAGIEEKQVQISEVGLKGTAKQVSWLPYTVYNRGVVAGPQTYAEDVFETDEEGVPVDPPVLLHAAGDPVLDENGDQIVIPELLAERVAPARTIDLPLAQTLFGIQFLTDGITNGDWSNFDLIRSVPEYNFIEFRASVEVTPATAEDPAVEQWKLFKARFNEDGTEGILTEIQE